MESELCCTPPSRGGNSTDSENKGRKKACGHKTQKGLTSLRGRCPPSRGSWLCREGGVASLPFRKSSAIAFPPCLSLAIGGQGSPQTIVTKKQSCKTSSATEGRRWDKESLCPPASGPHGPWELNAWMTLAPEGLGVQTISACLRISYRILKNKFPTTSTTA